MSAPQVSNEQIISLLEKNRQNPEYASVYRGASDRDVDDSLDYLFDADEQLFPLAVRLMTTGSPSGQELVKDAFSQVVNGLAGVLNERYDHPDWDRSVPTGSDIRNDMLNNWHVANVANECKMPQDRKFLMGFISMSGFINTMYRSLSRKDGRACAVDVHWRGISAMSLTGLYQPFSPTLPSYSIEFIEWAGERESLNEIIPLAKEREVLNPLTLEGLLAQTGVESALKGGIL